MLLTTILVLSTLLPRLETVVREVRPDFTRHVTVLVAGEAPPAIDPVFQPDARSVSNWRLQAGDSLRPASLALVVRYATTDPAFVARCVKLNNYWCIKRARWNGEIGADAEGHTGFATAADGADAAAQLLRRYYREFGRRTALAIVRRWAPSECRVGDGMPLLARGPAALVSSGLAPRGLGRTLRARFLARHPRGGVARVAATPRGGALRIQPWSPLARMGARPKAAAVASVRSWPSADAKPSSPLDIRRTPATGALLVRPSEILVKPSQVIAKPSVLLIEPSAVLGRPPTSERPKQRSASTGSLQERFLAESAALPAIAAGLPKGDLLDLSVPAPLCANDETRIRNYATRIAASAGLQIEDDLKLFEPEGRPSPNLRSVMLAMSSVELGSLRATPALVDAAIARLDATVSAGHAATTP